MTTSMRGLRAAFVCVLVLLLVAAGFVFDLKQGEDLLIQRQYKDAAQALEKSLGDAAAADKDRVLFLLGRARFLAGDMDGALAAFRQLEQQQAGSDLVHQARFQEAKALEKSGKLREAAQIYRDEIEGLIGLSRKEEVAATYLGLAEKALGAEPVDHQRAVTFFDLALDLGLQPEKARAIRLKAAESYLALGNQAEAQKRLQPLVKELTPETGKLRAMLALGRARRQGGDQAGARAVLRDLRALAPAASEAGDAAYEIALSYGVPAPNPAELDRAVAALRELAAKHPAHPKAKAALYLQALCFRHVGRADDALSALQQFLQTQGDSGIDEVAAARAAIGDVLAGQGKAEPAIAAWREYLRLHPAHGEWERVQRAIVDAEYGLAFAAYAAGKEQFDAARERFSAFARTYPLDPRNPDILYLLGDMLQQEQKYDQAKEQFARCVSKYPGKDPSSHSQFAIGQIYEQKTFNYEAALKAYREVKWGQWQGEAQQRIALLTRKNLHLRTERIFHTDEKPAFELTSRNIDKVRVRVFRLDLEDYFRATHTAGEVQRLDIEVIEPDQTFDSAVPDYLRYRETTRAVPLPFDKPGAYVVKVDDKELEATTLVLVSDMALIAKSSRHEFFVFTQNSKENRPEGGVKVVLSDGKKVIAEGVTATDGVWRWQGKELQNLDDLRVFAVDASGSGASSLNLSGMGFAPGLLAKGFLFTDRPLYQPGQRVNLKGIIREVKDGLYRLPATDDYRVQVWSAGGRLLLQREVKFTSFGTFAGELDLPADAELGDWRIAVGRTGHDELVFTGGFAVARYERPRLSLKIDLQQPVVFRGEKIQGKVVVNHFYGEPAVGKDVVLTMALPDGQQIERQAATNAAGEVVIDFDTTEFAEEAMAMITARLPADNVGTRTVVPVVTSEFAPTAKTVRKVYLAGEPFEVEVGIQDRSGRPLAREATAVLLRLEQHQVNNNPSVAVRLDDVEVEVERKPVKTGADGIGRVTFSSKKGGQYRVRIEAKDRFGNVVSGDAMLTVSGDDDKVKLRLLCDRESFRVGEAAAVKIVNRAGARLALLCWQGDGILAYETRVLPVGESELQLPLLPQHAPNFALAVAMVDGNKFHQAEREFRVLRDLRVTVKAPLTARPGAEVELAVEAQDPQGKPVQAEVAVAMVDEALLALHGDTTPAISQFFFGQLRETGFRTVTSCTWAYDGPSKPVSGALLAEDERRRLEEAAKLPAAGAPLAAEVLDHALLQQLEKGESEDKAGRPAGSAGVLTGGKVLDRDAGRTKNGRAVPGSPAARRAAANEPAKSGKEADSDEMALGAVRMFTDNVDAEQPTYFGYVKLATGGWQTKQGQDLNALMFGDLSDIHMGTPLDRAFAAESNQPRTNFSESGAWLSALTTDSNGRGSAKVTLPHSTTGWLLKARAVTADTYVGEGEAKLRTTQELQVDLIGPPALVEGDETQLQIHAHNLTDQAQDVHARWTSKGGFDGKGELTLHLGPHQEGEQSQLVRATGAEPVELGVDGSAGAFTDKLQRTLLVQPFGIEFRDGRAGSTKEREVFELSLPQGREFTALQLLVELGPDPGRDLLSAALGLGYMPTSCRQVEMTTLARASRGLAALLALDYLEQAGSGKKADQSRLLGQAQAVLTTLLSAQLPDGSFAWAGKRTVDVRSTCQALRFFAACRHRGLAAAEAPANKAGEWLLQFLRTAGNEQRPDVLWALASVERARFESLNSIHRVRTGLALDSLARLALAWHESKRPELAAEALDVLRQKLTAATMKQQQLEAVALAARALLQHDKRDALGTAAVEFLRHARMGVSWGTPEATAAAIAVLAMAQGSGAGTGRSAEFKVLVNGHELATTPKEATGMNMVFSVPAGWLQQRGNKVEVTVSGGAEVHYAANLIGFARGFKVEDKNDQLVHVERKYLADVLRQDNKEVPQGFSIVQGNNIRTFENKITQLRQGETARARLGFWIRHETDQKTMTPLVVEEPLPAGCSVPRDSIHGNFEDVDVQPDRLLFYYREGVTSDWISYDLQARFPGNYRVLPARVYGALRPELLAYSDTGSLRVNARSAAEHDDYTLTPDELYHLGKNAFDAGALLSGELRAQRLQQSWQHLDKLLADWHKKDFYLRDDVFKEVARMMLFLGIERNDSKAIVRFFEELKDRYADLVIPFDKILAVGKAYLDLGEFEAALLVFRATADASFLKEANVATTLENLGEIKASTQFLERLLLAYPDLNTMRASRYGIGQKLAELAARIDPTAPVDDKIGSVAQLRARALAAFREFLICYPEDPLAEEVSFAWATTQVEGKDLKAALLVAEAALQRYPQSPFTDEFLYTAGYAQFVLGNHDAAFAALKRVAEEEFPNDKGGKGPSESKWHAVYLQGQIHHARGEPALALAAYQKVEDRFSDAGEAADYFLRKQLALPEVSSFALDKTPELQITYRNIPTVAVQVFRVDLMRLYLMEKSLNEIRSIQLHGIQPLLSFEAKLGDGRDYKNQEKKLALDLKEPGAYLVVVRGGDLIATGMVLRTDLKIDTQEQFDSGRIRVNIKQGEAFAGDTHVKVIGSGDQQFHSGDTDLRGVFVGDGLVGMATVIAKKGDQYAFFRGTGVHQPQAFRPAPQQAQQEQQQEYRAHKDAKKFDALEQNLNSNSMNRGRQVEWLKNEVLNKQQQGVEVYRAK